MPVALKLLEKDTRPGIPGRCTAGNLERLRDGTSIPRLMAGRGTGKSALQLDMMQKVYWLNEAMHINKLVDLTVHRGQGGVKGAVGLHNWVDVPKRWFPKDC